MVPSPEFPAGRVMAFHELVRAALFNASTLHLLTMELVGSSEEDFDTNEHAAPCHCHTAGRPQPQSQLQQAAPVVQASAPVVQASAPVVQAAPETPTTSAAPASAEPVEPVEAAPRRRRRSSKDGNEPASAVAEQLHEASPEPEVQVQAQSVPTAEPAEPLAISVDEESVFFAQRELDTLTSSTVEEHVEAVTDAMEAELLADANVLPFKPPAAAAAAPPPAAAPAPAEPVYTSEDLRNAFKKLQKERGAEIFAAVLLEIKTCYGVKALGDIADQKVLRAVIDRIEQELQWAALA